MDQPQPPLDENKIIAERRGKLAELRARQVAFPNDFVPDSHAEELQATYREHTQAMLESGNVSVSVAGRIILKREMGKSTFATIKDAGVAIQVYFKLDLIGQEAFADSKRLDLGDIIGVEGRLFKTRTGELTVEIHRWRLLAKSLRPLPDKFHGIADVELKYRQRYVGLIADDHMRAVFVTRSRVLAAFRQFMTEHGFLEVETPMLHPIPGGAAARPFVTHHNALDMQMFLRIAPELYLKRLIVGGFDRVFEINRNFRNEGVSPRHNPEFTMLEFYAAYTDYRWLMDYTERLLRQIARTVKGSEVFDYQGQRLDFAQPFDRLTIVEAIVKYAPEFSAAALADRAFVAAQLQQRGVDVEHGALAHGGLGALQLALFEEVAEHLLWQPTFIIDYPVEVSPLARPSDRDPSITERFELFITGREIGNAFSELNDPEDQARRFMAQVAAKDRGDEEAMYYDADYIRALEYGMPPTGGCGIGIDRVVMLMTDSANIRDVILFPHLRAEEPTGS